MVPAKTSGRGRSGDCSGGRGLSGGRGGRQRGQARRRLKVGLGHLVVVLLGDVLTVALPRTRGPW